MEMNVLEESVLIVIGFHIIMWIYFEMNLNEPINPWDRPNRLMQKRSDLQKVTQYIIILLGGVYAISKLYEKMG